MNGRTEQPVSRQRDPRGGLAPIELRLVVWQFVRVMVQLEKVARARGRQRAPALYGAWRVVWQEVDRRLTQLGKSDAAGFADLMMEQEIVVQCRNRAQLNELVRAVENVVNQLKIESKAAAGDTRLAADLRFERSELESLNRRLHKIAKASGRATGRAKPQPTARPTARRRAARQAPQ